MVEYYRHDSFQELRKLLPLIINRIINIIFLFLSLFFTSLFNYLTINCFPLKAARTPLRLLKITHNLEGWRDFGKAVQGRLATVQMSSFKVT